MLGITKLGDNLLSEDLTSGRADLADGDDDGLEAESQDSRSECRRCREHGYIERGVDQEGHEAEESPDAQRAVRARGEDRSNCKVCSACPHGRQRSSARSAVGHQSASTVVSARMQGVRWVINLRARSSALLVQGVRWVTICEHGRVRSQCKECGGASICEHGRRALSVQGVRWVTNMRARSSALSVQGVSKRTRVIQHPSIKTSTTPRHLRDKASPSRRRNQTRRGRTRRGTSRC